MRIALALEYDGSAFCGWQTQPSGCSVQDILERALAAVAGGPLRVTCAGRTDTGVHAHWQVVHFDTDVTRPPSAWVRGTNAHLPPAVSVLWASEVAEGFHARYAAVSRCYRYVLLPRRSRPGRLHGRVGWWHGPLDVARMSEGSACLVGEHDFGAFRAAECQASTPVRTVHSLQVREAGEFVVVDIEANAFLHHMVRNIVGCLVYVGAGRKDPGWVRTVLESRDRRGNAPTFEPCGLYLASVRYPPEHGIPAPPPMDGPGP